MGVIRIKTLLFLVSLLLLLLLSSPQCDARRHGGAGNKNKNRHYQSRKRECERAVCADWEEDWKPSCVLQCQSKSCYDDIYGGNELEPGEIDTSRSRQFSVCVNKELREWNRKGRS